MLGLWRAFLFLSQEKYDDSSDDPRRVGGSMCPAVVPSVVRAATACSCCAFTRGNPLASWGVLRFLTRRFLRGIVHPARRGFPRGPSPGAHSFRPTRPPLLAIPLFVPLFALP